MYWVNRRWKGNTSEYGRFLERKNVRILDMTREKWTVD